MLRLLLLGGCLIMLAANQATAQEPPLNVAEWESATEILGRAKTIISENGWYQVQPTGPDKECMATALEKGWLQSGKSLVDFEYARLALNRAIEAPPMTELTSSTDPLSTPYWGRYYMYWNDAPGRTEAEVLEALEKAISVAESERLAALKTQKTGADLEEFDKLMMQELGLGPSK